MVQTVKDIDGSLHSFPDDATPDEINGAFTQIDKERKFSALKDKVIGKPGFMANFTGGMLNGITSLAKNIPDMAKMVPDSMKSALPYAEGQRPIDKFDAYKTMGTTDQPISTLAGLEQSAGELFMPGKAATAGYPLTKKIATAAYNPVKSIGQKLIDKISPGRAANNLLQDLSKGAANTEEATSSIANDIKQAHDAREETAGAFFNYPLKQAGTEKIYEHVNPLITTKMDKAKSLMDQVKDLDVGNLFDEFKASPNFQNAHNLQSELGVMMGDLKRIPARTIAEKLQLADLKSARDTLKGDISDFLQKRDLNTNETLAPSYKRGSDFWEEHVVPYLSTNKLRQINREGRTSVPNIHKIFESPYDIVKKNGETKIGSINKIMQDLPDETKDKILFNKIGAYKNADKPDAVVRSLNNADQGGYSKLMSQDIKNKLLDIKGKSKNYTRLKYGAGLAGLAGTEELLRNLFK